MRDAGGESQAPLFQAACSLLIHSEQVRWNILYYFLVAHSILILAWATVYAAAERPGGTTVLWVLPAAGCVLGALHLALAERANVFVDQFWKRASELERSLGNGAVAIATDLRVKFESSTVRSGLGSAEVSTSVPVVVTVLQLTLLGVSIAQAVQR